jgi:RimJ/RimL family protein N-acetyltransferase
MKPDITLRGVTAADLPRLYEHQSDPVSVRMAAFPPRDQEEFTAHWAKILVDPSVITRAILFEGEVTGYVVIFGPAEERLVGYWIGREFWGKGLATRALAAVLHEISERPLFARVAKHNVGSVRVLEKCGFTVAGEDKVAFGDDGEIVEDWIMKL